MQTITDIPSNESLDKSLNKLKNAITNGRSRAYCLRLWSKFIRLRDGNRCVDCHSRSNLTAHHICRKSFTPLGEFETGNGITLCDSCHRPLHDNFNGRPDLSQPVDAQGGEKLELMERLYSILTDDAVERGITNEKFYYLSDDMLAMFKRMQGYEGKNFPGARIEQAYLILAECEWGIRHAELKFENVPIIHEPLLPGGFYLVHPASKRGPQRAEILRTYKARWKVK